MKKFIEKLIEKFEEEINWYETHGCNEKLKRAIIGANRHAIGIANELAEEYKSKDCSECSRRKFYQQGYEDAKKEYINTSTDTSTDTSSGWIPCSERLPEEATTYEVTEEVVVNSKKLYIVEHRIFGTEGEWLLPSNRKVIAWMPLPAPYKEEGENE
jgi:hypothetical protein